MTLAQLNEHLDAVQQLARTEETLKNLWDAAVPGAQKLTGMPHASGVRDKVGDFAVEIADLESEIEREKAVIAESEERIAAWISTIEDGTTRIIFRLRFIRAMQWKEIAGIVGKYSTESSVKHAVYVTQAQIHDAARFAREAWELVRESI